MYLTSVFIDKYHS